MRLALAEVRRRRGRWIAISGAVGFIVFFVLVLSALSDGLFNGNTSALRTSTADAYVFSADGRRPLVRSQLPITQLPIVAAAEGVADAGALAVLLATAGPADEAYDIALMGHVPGHAGEPSLLVEGRRPDPGEASAGVADVSLKAEGIELGDTVTLTGSTLPVEVVGFVDDAQYLLAPTLWVPLDTWQAVSVEIRPETGGRGAVVQAFPMSVEAGRDVEAVAADVDRALESTETVTTGTAIFAIQGVDQQRTTAASDRRSIGRPSVSCVAPNWPRT